MDSVCRVPFCEDLNNVETERRDTTYRIPARGGILHVVSRYYVLNQLGNATSDPTAFKKSIRSLEASSLRSDSGF